MDWRRYRHRRWVFAAAAVILVMALIAIVTAWTDRPAPPGQNASQTGAQPAQPAQPAAVSTKTTDHPTLPASPASADIGALARMASARGQPASATIGPEGGTLPGEDGVKLLVPPQSLPKPTKITLTSMDLALSHVAFDVASSRVYVVSADADVPKLDPPLMLEIPWDPDKPMTLGERSNGTWRAHPPGEKGAPPRILITHFSRSVFGMVEWVSEISRKINRVAEGDNPRDTVNFERRKIEASTDPNVRAFFGVGEHAANDHHGFCQEFRTMLAGYSSKENLKFPDDWSRRRMVNTDGSFEDLGLFLHDAGVPAKHGGFFYEAVKDSIPRIRQALTAYPGQASPAEFLRICIVANGNNVPLGVLAAHNYLKEDTYFARDSWDFRNRMPENAGQTASHLAPWRQDPIAPGGYYDKMGPLYHVFAAMTAAVWGYGQFGAVDLGKIAIEGEAFLRAFRFGADQPDSPKAMADECGMEIGGWIILGLTGDPTRLLHASRHGNFTRIDFHSDELESLDPNDLPFRLYRASSPDGPWTFAGGKNSQFVAGTFSSPIEITPEKKIAIDDRLSYNSNDLQPPFYRVARASPSRDGKEEEVYSAVLPPSRPRLVVHEVGPNIIADSYTQSPPRSPQDVVFDHRFVMLPTLELTDQAFWYPSAHLTVTWAGATWHFWTRHGKEQGYGPDTYALLWLPGHFGSQTLTIKAEGAGGAVAQQTITVNYNPPFVAERRAGLDKPMEPIAEIVQRGESASVRAQALQKRIDAEKDEARKQDLRYDLINVQMEALDLEERRLELLIKRAATCGAATEYARGLQLATVWASRHPDFAKRRLEWTDRAIGWGVLHRDSNHAAEDEYSRKTTVSSDKNNWRYGMALGLKLAICAGDYNAARYFGLKLRADMASSPNATIGDAGGLDWVNAYLASATATLGGQRELAASLLQTPPHLLNETWWPPTDPAAPPAVTDDDLKKLDDAIAKSAADTQKSLNLPIQPPAP